MSISLFPIRCLLLSAALTCAVFCQDASAPAAAKTPLDHVIGTITAVDKTAQTVTVQEDKTNAPYVIQLVNTKTLLKVEPSAKDLKGAVRITADDLEASDRVDVRGTKLEDTPTTLNARSVILMSGRALAVTHEQQAAAWTKATSGLVGRTIRFSPARKVLPSTSMDLRIFAVLTMGGSKSRNSRA